MRQFNLKAFSFNRNPFFLSDIIHLRFYRKFKKIITLSELSSHYISVNNSSSAFNCNRCCAGFSNAAVQLLTLPEHLNSTSSDRIHN
jgi:hypothetical protein